MKQDWLMQALGDVDPDLVERAAQPPRKRHPLRWVAAVAAMAVMVTGVGVWRQHRPEDTLPISNSDTPVEDIAPPDTSTETPVTSLAEAKAAIAEGRYQEAYRYLLTDTSAEAVQLLDRFCYVPVGVTDSRDGESHTLGSWEVDDSGNLLLQSIHNGLNDGSLEVSGGGKATREEYTYDEKGRLKTMAMVYTDGEKESRDVYTYTYDAAGNLTKKEFASINGQKTIWVYTYDERGNCVKEEYGDEGDADITITYTYNEVGQLLLRYQTYGGSDGWQKTEYSYDANGNLIKDAFLTSNGSGWTYEYTYDADGTQTSYSHTLPDEPNHWQKWYIEGNQKISESLSQGYIYEKSVSVDDKCIYWYFRRGSDVTETEFTYDENGNRLTQLWWSGGQGEYTVYTYDEQGNSLQTAVYAVTDRNDPEGTATLREVTDAYTYVYDADGRILRQEHTDEDGKVTTTEATYTAAGMLLTRKTTYYNDEWECVAHTYDEDGYKIATEQSKSDGTWTKETFDIVGNRLSFEDGEGNRYTCEWSLRYYPNGLTEQQRADLAQIRRNAQEFTGDSMDFDE